MTRGEKERLLSALYEDGGLRVKEPEELLPTGENGLLDAQVLSETGRLVERELSGGCFALIDDGRFNARAARRDGVPVVAVHTGVIVRLLDCAGRMMRSDRILSGVGEQGGPLRAKLGLLMAHLAAHFMIFHEVGHHKKGHLETLRDGYGLRFSDAADEARDIPADRKMLEAEADLYATARLIDHSLAHLAAWGKALGEALTYANILQILIPALVLVKENLSVGAVLPRELEESSHLPNMVRLSYCLVPLTLDPRLKGALEAELSELFREDGEFRAVFERENGLAVFEDGGLTEKAFLQYFVTALLNAEQAYCTLFIGSSYAAAFRPDVLAMEWFGQSGE